MNIEQLRFEAYKKGDTSEVKRLERLIQRLDEQRVAYGKENRK